MVENVVKIEGMACSMCEVHINDVIRKTFPDAKKVKASHTKKQATFLTEESVAEDVLKKAIDDTGYEFVALENKPYEKKGLFGQKK